MKFGKLLLLGMYPPWSEYYIAYDRLKRIIDRKVFLKKKNEAKKNKSSSTSLSSRAVTELTPLCSSDKVDSFESVVHEDDKSSFMSEVDKELDKITKFFDAKVLELRVQLDELVEKWNEQHSSHHTTHLLSSHLVEFRHLFNELTALQEYGPLNRTGFYKILKKYDKNMNEKNMKSYLTKVDEQSFVASHEPSKMIEVISNYVSRSKLVEWKHASKDESESREGMIFPSLRPQAFFLSVLVFIISFQFPAFNPNNPNSHRCLSLVVLVVSLWLSNAMPYYATAMLVPAIIPALHVMRDRESGLDMPPDEAAKYLLNSFFSHSTILLFGGYTLSCALSRCQFELRVAAWLQKKFGHSPNIFLLSVMLFGLVLSMWISNHTAPILIAAILRPIVQDLHKDSSYAKSLLLGLAFSCNFGGMMTPISSLQNILAVSNLEKIGIEVSFLDWIIVSVPLALFFTLLSWGLICILYRPDDVKFIPVVVYDRENKPYSSKNLTVLFVSLLAMAAFASFGAFKPFLGDVGVVALVYATFMFGSGILTELDFNSLSWHTLFLLAGGDALGKAVQSSGLLEELSVLILSGIPTNNQYLALLYMLSFATAVATFVSHTVASMILIPMVAQVGVDIGMPEVLVIGVAFAVSAAMALPFSSFPNVNSVQISDDFQSPYLQSRDFIKTGLPLTLVSVLGISVVGRYFIEHMLT